MSRTISQSRTRSGYPVLRGILLAGLLLACCCPSLVLAQSPDRKTKDLSFDDIKFEMKKGTKFKRSMLTEKIEDYAGKTIRIRGYILPSFQQRGIKQFVLVRDNLECCFGPGAALFDCIIVDMESPATVDFTVRPIAVEGVFSVKPFKAPDGKHLAIYHLKGTKAK